MAPPVSERPESAFEGIGALLAPFPGRLEFAARLALICALATLVAEIYQTLDPALTAYVAFFVMKPDRVASIATSIAMTVLITLLIGLVLGLALQVIDQPLWRVTVMVLMSLGITFAASASKLKPLAGTIALIVAYALDLLGTVPGGETTTRGLLYVWLFVGIPAGLSILVNLVLGPAPRRLAERALAHRLRLAGAVLRAPAPRLQSAFEECLREGAGEIPAWLKLAGVEKTSPPRDLAALRQAAQSTIVILSLVDFIVNGPEPLPPAPLREGIAQILDDMAAILAKGGYPVGVALEFHEEEATLTPSSAAAIAELQAVLAAFAEPPPPDPAEPPVAEPKSGFFLPDAFTNPAHVQYALKTTGAAMFCYVTYLLLNWPGIHTCLITCYIVSLGTAAETAEKQTLRFVGCLVGAAAGLAAIVFLMPNVTSIGGLMAVVFLAALASGWIAAGSPRISYVGFQLAFAFFLSVIQGAAPAFDMTIARDRTIGILFGDVVVAIVFTLVWPVSVAKRVDPAIAALFRRLAALASATSAPKRWGLAVEARAKLGSIEQDLGLMRYEPSATRPAGAWVAERREVARNLSALQVPLLVGADQRPGALDGIARRLDRLAERFGAAPEPATPAVGIGRASGSPDHAVAALIEAPLVQLEQLAAEFTAPETEGRLNHAPA
jgi:multidrug resistance protein MdtO